MSKISLRKDKGSWVISFTYEGTQIKHYSGYPSEERNRLIANAIAADIEGGLYDVTRNRYRKPKVRKIKATPVLSPSEAIDKYLKDATLKPSTEYQYAIAWRLCKGVKSSNGEVILQHLLKCNITTTTLSRIITCINAAYTHCGIKWDKPKVPMGGVKGRPTNANSEPHWLSPAEVEAILQWASATPHYLHFIKLCLLTGGRMGEIVALTYGDYDPLNRVLLISKNVTEVNGVQTFNSSTKTGEDRYFPANDKLHALLDTKKEGLVVPPFNAKVYFDYSRFKKDFCKEFKKRTPYNFRDTFIFEQLFTHGVDIDTIAAWCGNSPKVIRDSYLSKKQIALRQTPK